MDAETALERLCYGGEELREVAVVRSGAVGLTSHRVLVLRPDGPGARFRAVDRPNVTGIAVRTSGPTAHRDRAVTAAVAAGVLLVAGSLIDLGGFVEPVAAPEGMGIGGLLTLVDVLIAALGLLDEALLLIGLGALLWALGFLALYLRGRDRVLEITVAGDDPVRLPVAAGETTAADRLQGAMGARPSPGGETAEPLD